MKTITLLISLSALGWLSLFGQTEQSVTNSRTDSEKQQNAQQLQQRKDSLLISKLQNSRIVLKDGCMKKKCCVKQINEFWIVYEKDGSLHDQTIEEIRRIEMEGNTLAVFFDEKNKPIIKPINWSQ